MSRAGRAAFSAGSAKHACSVPLIAASWAAAYVPLNVAGGARHTAGRAFAAAVAKEPFFWGATFPAASQSWVPSNYPPTGTGRHRQDISVVPDGWWVRGAASARRQGPRAAQAHPLPHCTRGHVGARGRSRQMRAARQLPATPTNVQPRLTAPLAAAPQERRRTCAVPTDLARWRLHCQSGHQPRPRPPPSGSAGRAQARGTSGAACVGRLPQGPCRVARQPLAAPRQPG